MRGDCSSPNVSDLRRVHVCLRCWRSVDLCPADAALSADDDDPDAQEQAAFQAAVDRVAPSVVQIETVGGLEKVGDVLFGTGPTTGLVVDRDGYIISSAFNFVSKPTSILVRLPDGERKPAKLVATDHSRMLVLLKIDADKPLPVCEIAPQREMRRRPMDDRRRANLRERTAEHGGRHPQRRRSHLGQGHSDRRRRLAEQLRRAAGRHPRPRAGRARAAFARGRRRRSPAWNGTTRASASPFRWNTSSRSCRD